MTPRNKKPLEVLEEIRARRRAEFHADPSDPRHGTENGYRNLKCRCSWCSAANTRSHLAYMNDPDHPERAANHRESIRASRAASKANHPSNRTPSAAPAAPAATTTEAPT